MSLLSQEVSKEGLLKELLRGHDGLKGKVGFKSSRKSEEKTKVCFSQEMPKVGFQDSKGPFKSGGHRRVLQRSLPSAKILRSPNSLILRF